MRRQARRQKKAFGDREDPIIRGKKEETDAMTPAEQEALYRRCWETFWDENEQNLTK